MKVWTGNDDCKEETWEECKPHYYEAEFEKDMVKCENSTRIPYCNNCKTVYKPITTQSITCKPKSAVQCKPVKRQICSYGEYFLQYIFLVCIFYVLSATPDLKKPILLSQIESYFIVD